MLEIRLLRASKETRLPRLRPDSVQTSSSSHVGSTAVDPIEHAAPVQPSLGVHFCHLLALALVRLTFLLFALSSCLCLLLLATVKLSRASNLGHVSNGSARPAVPGLWSTLLSWIASTPDSRTKSPSSPKSEQQSTISYQSGSREGQQGGVTLLVTTF